MPTARSRWRRSHSTISSTARSASGPVDDPPVRILAEGRRLAEQHGESLTLAQFRRATRISRRELKLWFNGWSGLRTQLGLRPSAQPARRGPTPEQISAAFEAALGDIGPDITQRQFFDHSGLNCVNVQTHFGSYGNLRVQHGLARRVPKSTRIPDAELLADVLRVWHLIADAPSADPASVPTVRFPTVDQYARHGQFAPAILRARFGSQQEIQAAVRKHAAAIS